MARKQKLGLETSTTRTLLLDAAELLMRSEGYAAVTSRRLGDAAGVKPQLVHYYFASMDDLFVTLYRRRAERVLQLAEEELQLDQVLSTLWTQNSDPGDVALNLEFMALGNHRKAVRAEAVKYGEQLRRMQHKALLRYLRQRNIKLPCSAGAFIVLLASAGLLLVLESDAGMKFGHVEAKAVIATTLRSLQGKVATRAKLPKLLPRKRGVLS